MSDDRTAEPLRYRYRFTFPDGTAKRFEISLHRETLELIPATEPTKPEWTRLKYHQCENCPLGDDVDYCPVAVNLATVVETFKDNSSFENTTVTVEAAQRTYQKATTLQKGLSAIIGTCMVTSNCPIMDQLRPNVRFHLPFASSEETIYRAISMYLTAQYFVMQRGGKPDWELKKLAEIYGAVSVVNRGMSRRLSEASAKDANVNAVIILATLGGSLAHFLEDSLDLIEPWFREGPIPPKK